MLPPEELHASRKALAEFLEDSPMRSLVKLDMDFHLQPKMEPTFESMVVSAGGTPAGNLTLADTLTLTQGLIYNFKHHPSPHDDEYVLLMHALVNHTLEREQLQDTRDAQKVESVLQRIGASKTDAFDGKSYGISYPKKIKSAAQFKEVEETSRQLTMLTDGVDVAATSHLSERNKELLRDMRSTLIEHLCRMHIPEFSEDSLHKTLKHKIRNCPISRHKDKDGESFVIQIPEHHILRKNPTIKDKLIATLVGSGAEVDVKDDRITVTPEAGGLLAAALSALEKQASWPVRYR